MNGSGSRTGIDVVGRGSTELGLIAYERRDERGPVGIAHTHSSLHAGASVGSSITFSGESRTHLGSLRPTDPTELAYGLNGTIRSGGQYLPVNRRDAETISTALESSDVDRTFVTPSQYGDLMSLGAVDEGVVPIRSPRATTGIRRSLQRMQTRTSSISTRYPRRESHTGGRLPTASRDCSERPSPTSRHGSSSSAGMGTKAGWVAMLPWSETQRVNPTAVSGGCVRRTVDDERVRRTPGTDGTDRCRRRRPVLDPNGAHRVLP